MGFFRKLWAWILAQVGGLFRARPPRPNTLIERIERLDDKERELIRVAEEAQRRGFPEQALTAYWKAVRHYHDDGRIQKMLSVLGAILRIRPDDVEAHVARASGLSALGRRRDAALSYLDAAHVFELRGERGRALELLELCVDLDRTVEGLEVAYARLGGRRNPWARRESVVIAPSLSMATDTHGFVQDLVGDLMEDFDTGVEAPIALELESGPDLETHEDTRAQDEAPIAGAWPGRLVSDLVPSSRSAQDAERLLHGREGELGFPSLPGDRTLDDDGARELQRELTHEDVMHGPAARTPRPPVRFAIPAQETIYEEGPPAAMSGTEHAPGRRRSSELDAETQAFDKEALARLLAESRRRS